MRLEHGCARISVSRTPRPYPENAERGCRSTKGRKDKGSEGVFEYAGGVGPDARRDEGGVYPGFETVVKFERDVGGMRSAVATNPVMT